MTVLKGAFFSKIEDFIISLTHKKEFNVFNINPFFFKIFSRKKG
jgi:hypothetical protein